MRSMVNDASGVSHLKTLGISVEPRALQLASRFSCIRKETKRKEAEEKTKKNREQHKRRKCLERITYLRYVSY